MDCIDNGAKGRHSRAFGWADDTLWDDGKGCGCAMLAVILAARRYRIYLSPAVASYRSLRHAWARCSTYRFTVTQWQVTARFQNPRLPHNRVIDHGEHHTSFLFLTISGLADFFSSTTGGFLPIARILFLQMTPNLFPICSSYSNASLAYLNNANESPHVITEA